MNVKMVKFKTGEFGLRVEIEDSLAQFGLNGDVTYKYVELEPLKYLMVKTHNTATLACRGSKTHVERYFKCIAEALDTGEVVGEEVEA